MSMGRLVLALAGALGCGDDGGRAVDSGAGMGTDAGDSTDAGSPDSGADAGIDPTAVHWESIDPPADGPLRVWGHIVAWSGDGRAVVFGGTNATMTSGIALDGAWLFDARGGAPVFTELTGTGPTARYCGCAAWDRARDVVVVSGGRDVTIPDTIVPETWELDPDTGTWTMIPVPVSPPGRVGCALAYSAARDAVYLFGGLSMEIGHSDRTYRYDPAAPAWIELGASGPVARYDGGLAPLGDGRRLILFAGAAAAMGAGFYDDTWIFDTTTETWSELSVTGDVPPARRVPWMVVDAERGVWAGLGADSMLEPLGDLWYLDIGAALWTRVSAGAIPARGFCPALPAGPGALGHALGGWDGTGPIRDVSRLSPAAP
jgi:hypothetical protein